MIIKNFQQVKLDKQGYEINEDGKRTDRFYGIGMPVWTFDLYFADTRRFYDTEWVRARDNRVARRKIRKQYPWVEKFEFGAAYAD